MGNNLLVNNPFAILTFIVAPAILTNATSVLAMSTINRMLRARERMHQLYEKSEEEAEHDATFLEQVNRAEAQGIFLIRAMGWIYLALGAFAAASLVTLLGAVAGQLGNPLLMHAVVVMGLLLGILGVTGLMGGCVNLFRATQLSMVNIRQEAALIHERHARKLTSQNRSATEV